MGTPQGAVISPLLANIYLRYVFDQWGEVWRKRQARRIDSSNLLPVRGRCLIENVTR